MLSRDGTTYLCGSCRFYQPVPAPLGSGLYVCHPKQVIAYLQRDGQGGATVMTQFVRPVVQADNPEDACGQWSPNVRRPPIDVHSPPDRSRN